MDANLLGQCIHEASDAVVDYSIIKPLDLLLPVDLNTSEQIGACCHFSIRGYVDAISKSDTKICWPFGSLHTECNPENNGNLLPPMSVAKFRWWNCENCLLNDSGTENDGLRKVMNENGCRNVIADINLPIESDSDTQNHMFSSPLVASIISIPKTMAVTEDCKSADGMEVADATEEGGLHKLEDRVLQHSRKCYEAISDEQCQMGEQQNLQVSCPLNGFNKCHSVSKSSLNHGDYLMVEDHDVAKLNFNTLPKYAGINCEESSRDIEKDREYFHTKAPQSPSGANASCQDVSFQKSDEIQVPEISTGGSEHQHCRKIRKNEIIVESEDDENNDQSVKMDHRKVRKTRMLSDIIKSEVSRMSNMISETSEDEMIHVDYKNNERKALPKEDAKPTCKKQHKTKAIPAISRDETAYSDAQRNVKTDNMLEEVIPTCKRHSKSIQSTAISEELGAHADDKNIGMTTNLREEIKHTVKKQRPKLISEVVEVDPTHIDGRNKEKADKLKGETKHTGKKYDIADQDMQKTKYKNKKRLEFLDTDDEGSSLVHWMKRSSKKVEAYKLVESSKQSNSIKMHSDPSRTVSSSKVLTLRKNDQPFLHGKTTKGSKLGTQKPSLEVENQGVVQLKDAKDPYVLTVPRNESKKSKFGNSFREKDVKNILNPKPPSLDMQSEKDVTSNLHEESALQQEDITMGKDNINSRISWQKDSGSMIKEKRSDDIGACSKVSKKRTSHKTDKNVDATSVDGIPVEILKLLQDNWQKRHLEESAGVNREGASTSKETIKDGKEPPMEHPEGNAYVKKRDTMTAAHEFPTDPYKQQPHKEYTIRTANEAPIEPSTPQPCVMSSSKPYSLYTEPLSTTVWNRRERMLPFAPRDQCGASEQIDRSSNGYQAIGKCKDFRSFNEKTHMPIRLSESSNYRQQTGNRLDACPISITTNGCNPQDHNLQWFTNGVRNLAEGHKISGHSFNGNYYHYQTTQAAMNFGIRDPGTSNMLIHSKGKEVLLKGDSMKRKRVIEEAKCRKTVKQPVAQFEKQKHVLNLQSNIDTHPITEHGSTGNVRPLDLGANETISALNLLRMMDPDVYSPTPMCVSTDNSTGKFGRQSNFTYNFLPKGPCRASSENRCNLENRNPLAPENVGLYNHSGTSLNLSSHAPSSGAPVPFYLKDGVVNHPGCDPRMLRHFLGTDTGKVHSYLDNCTSNAGNLSDPCSRVAPFYSFLSDVNHEGNPYPRSQISSFGKMIQVEQRDKAEAAQIVKRSCPTEICVVNRNPADFTIPSDDNKYMTGYEDLQLGVLSLAEGRHHLIHPNHHRKRKALSLIATKGLLRS